MNRATLMGAGLALVFVCNASPAAENGFLPDDPDVETEIVNIAALSLMAAVPTLPGASIPVLHQPARGDEESNPGDGQVPLGDIAFSPNDSAASLWERIRSGFALEELPSPLVKDWENWYASRPDYVSRMVERGERYLFYVVEEVEKRRMPAEVALLPMIESAYNPTAYSRAHASGMWQFIPSTGKIYGLKQDWWQDERRDVIAATRAALDYLEKLYEMFNSWELALAAYNWGEGAVARAIQRNESRGMRTDYLSLDMPAETRNYLPKLMAVKNLVANPESLGLSLAEVPNRPYFTVVTTARHIDVKLAARFADMPLDEFMALNPSHNRPVIRAEPSQSILLPADRVERFQAQLETHAAPLVSWQPYTIGRRDSLEEIASRFGISAAQLREVNSLSSRTRNLAGLTILVPAADEKPDNDVTAAGFAVPSAPEAAPSRSPIKYLVKRGDSLALIARRFDTSVTQIATRNKIRNGHLLAGQTLIIEPPGAASQVTKAPTPPATRVAAATKKPARNGKQSAQKKQISGGRVQVAYTGRD